MTETAAADVSETLTTADGRPLKVALAQAEARAKRRAFLLVLPLLALILITFVIPIGQMLKRSVHNSGFIIHKNFDTGVKTPIMTNLSAWFDENPQGTEPDEAAYSALAQDLIFLRELKAQGQVGTRVNYEVAGTRSLFTKTARKAKKLEPPFKAAILDVDEDWADKKLWQVMRGASSAYTANFYLAAVDRTRDADGNIVRVNENRRVYVKLFRRTLLLSALITFATFVLAYPIAHLLATLPLRYSNLLMIFVLLPFWTSLLVRTTAWIVLLQTHGVINDLLVWAGLIGDEARVQMIYNMTGTIVAMTHILLPFMVLPIYSVMKTISPSHMRAALSLGANPLVAFWRVYAPQTVPGIGAGSILVFIISIGYYITPALVGGRTGQLISNFIAFHMQKSLNWGLAAALGTVLLVCVLLLYWLYSRVVGLDKLKLG